MTSYRPDASVTASRTSCNTPVQSPTIVSAPGIPGSVSSGVIVKERSNVLILFYPVQTEDANKLIQEIREAYIKAFQQESVLRVDSFAMVSF